ncbi:hypothetical protein [Actinoplanes sp. N902-109]|uniref:hypothetical protein n=1 Tax=Actinoplanes sp. (strain N902-109) TaxID=649831 RepID=UPI00032955B7|nr:hypothetical protein [Actinoplanes sp. N902-109]AGL18222.1 hypothetical protein L083_4712 [Actinoplanes sp. N902-109]
MSWWRNRYVWVAAVLATTAGATALATSSGPAAAPPDLRSQIVTRVRTTLEQQGPEQHHHAGRQATTAPTVCGVHVYGYEPEQATALADVRTVYAFHFCGVAEPRQPWDVAVKLAGPVIVTMAADPPAIQVVEAGNGVTYVDRLRQMFPPEYAALAQKEALSPAEMTDVRNRYNAAAGAG